MGKIRFTFQVTIILSGKLSEIAKLTNIARGFVVKTIAANQDQLKLISWEPVKEEKVEEKAK